VNDHEGWQRIEWWLRAVVPFALTLLLTLISTLPLGIHGLGPVMPVLPAIAIYYWAIYRPDLLPLIATFFIGLVHDGLTGAPIGLTSLVLLLLHGAAGSQRKFFDRKGLAVTWVGFGIFATAAGLLSWASASLFYWRLMDLSPVAVQWLLTIAAYPLIAWPFGVLQRELLSVQAARGR
jgi:rod shape-determining protein MreD